MRGAACYTVCLTTENPRRPLAFASSRAISHLLFPMPQAEHAEHAEQGRPKKVLHITGWPGAGKGTQCGEILRSHATFTHLSVGELLRAEVQRGGPLGSRIASYIDKGFIVPPELVMDMLKAAIQAAPTPNVILDGFPRTTEQARLYSEIVGPADLTLVFECTEPVSRARLSKRMAEGSDRKDDTPEVMETRFSQYYTLTAPAISWARENVRNVISVDCLGDIPSIFAVISELLREHGFI